jgi:NAD(P)-dependent dehydrogenase (short-subunit alcohol dehydrogenase family)
VGERDRTSRSGRPVAVVTGASAGVGRATAIAFADAGFDVGLIARGEDGLRRAVDDVLARGGRAVATLCDVADWPAVQRAAREIEDHLGPVSVWVNNAMTTVFAPIEELEPDEIKRATEVTYLGQVHGTLAALELMRPRDNGVIVSVGSALAYRPIPLQAPYCAAKHAVRGFMGALRTELLHNRSHIRITQVHLPAVNTPQFTWGRTRVPNQPQPVPPIYKPEVAAKAIVAAAQSGPRQRIVGSWNWLVVQSNKLIPGVLDHFAARTDWEGQQVPGQHIATREGNLDKAQDNEPGTDHGESGPFGSRAHGVWERSFLRSLPQVARDLAASIRDRARELTAPTAR